MALTFGRVLDGKTATRIEREVASAIKRQETDWKGNTFYTLLLVMLMLTLLILAVLIYGVVADGWDVLTGWLPSFLGGTLGSIKAFEDQTLGVQQGLAGSFWIAVFVAVLSFPIGIAAAIYLEEYAPKNRFSNFIELNIRNLAGVPSVVYGLLGLFLFVEGIPSITGGRTAASAGLTLAILVLPIVIITAQEALRAVPDALKEGSFGVGGHPLGDDPATSPPLCGTGHPHWHAAVHVSRYRRGGALDFGGRDHWIPGLQPFHHRPAPARRRLHRHAYPDHRMDAKSDARIPRGSRCCYCGLAGVRAAAERSHDLPEISL